MIDSLKPKTAAQAMVDKKDDDDWGSPSKLTTFEASIPNKIKVSTMTRANETTNAEGTTFTRKTVMSNGWDDPVTEVSTKNKHASKSSWNDEKPEPKTQDDGWSTTVKTSHCDADPVVANAKKEDDSWGTTAISSHQATNDFSTGASKHDDDDFQVVEKKGSELDASYHANNKGFSDGSRTPKPASSAVENEPASSLDRVNFSQWSKSRPSARFGNKYRREVPVSENNSQAGDASHPADVINGWGMDGTVSPTLLAEHGLSEPELNDANVFALTQTFPWYIFHSCLLAVGISTNTLDPGLPTKSPVAWSRHSAETLLLSTRFP